MGNIISGNIEYEIPQGVKNADFSYSYPEGMNMKPGTELHDRIRNRLLERANAAATSMQTRFASWQQQDQFLTAYKRVDVDEAQVLSLDDRKPVSIVFPYSYAILETLLSYMISAFFRDPIFRYEGYSPEDVMGSIMLEQVINLHCNKFKVMLNLHTMFRDAFVYGIGVVAPYWKMNNKHNFEGNALRNVDPYMYLPDPNVPADRIQDGEFVGWLNETNYMDLLSEEENNAEMFNVQYLRTLGVRKSAIRSGDQTGRNLRTGSIKDQNSSILHPVDELVMYVKLIPSEWGLGAGKLPEKWLFRLAADNVIIYARKTSFNHNKFPIAVCCPDTDGYSATPLSRLEILSGLQGILDWLFNSHIANVRKAINDMIIYDPYAISTADISDPKPGKLIRVRRPLWGKGGINQYIQQLSVNDITKNNITDSTWIVNWMQKIGATDDAAMGALRTGGPERLTKAEFQGTSGGAISRLERIAKIIGLQAMQDIGEFFADHTQQMMTEPMYVKVGGDWGAVLSNEFSDSISRGRMAISPNKLNINYDVVVRDGSIPGGNNSDFMMRMFDTVAAQPELAQTFDIVKIFKSIARNSGEKNVNEFVRKGGGMNAQVMPNEQISQEAQAGNIIPMQGMM